MSFANFLAEAADEPKSNVLGIVLMVVVVVALIAVVFILPMFNNKKANKKYQSMLDTVKVGDTVKTIGGIVGVVTDIRSYGNQKEFALTTGDGENKTEMVFDINALYQIVDAKTHDPIPMQPIVADKSKKDKKKDKNKASDEETPFEEVAEAEQSEEPTQAESVNEVPEANAASDGEEETKA